ncbi:transposase [Chryseobacterium lactis]|uniref:Helix-turn-helix domain-containing protein n=1 Tax=Chryseobacterium lactis TaxID=1241981 RepID=A0A3G6RUE8_CHRLC|nr:transposase [Chryseobacterium lactis]AZA81629.1 helix-turn-helix domain-containing protein [Chryseobacterium lactis]AZB06627.1 helix-turn-helix domain-containing protein [Chryseobacterium lactis]PNW15478.1 transposase [Chryseobacterium lactis]
MNPDYKQIYTDLLREKCPEKLLDPVILKKLEKLRSAIDIFKFNQLIFDNPDQLVELNNQRLRSYDEKSIKEILVYQKKHKLTNSHVSNHFKISRNTIARWKAIFKD